jgi:hypothetical protein
VRKRTLKYLARATPKAMASPMPPAMKARKRVTGSAVRISGVDWSIKAGSKIFPIVMLL